jgi:hypothetical protein
VTTPLLRRVAGTLDAAAIPHALIGAAALATHGISRSTLDHDLLTTDARALDEVTWKAIGDARVEIRRGDADDPLAGVVRVTAAGERDVDVIVGRDAWQRALVDEAQAIDTAAGPLRVVSAAGLVLLKLYAGGAQDLWDIEQLRAAVGAALDADVDARIHVLPEDAQSAWARVKGR